MEESSDSGDDHDLDKTIPEDESEMELIDAARKMAPETNAIFGRVEAKGLIARVINLQRYSAALFMLWARKKRIVIGK